MRFSSYLTAGALAALANAQTFTECNPMEKDCPNNPAMPANFETDFKAGAAAVKGWKQTAGSLTYSPEGAEFTINKQGEAPTIQSEGYLHFGYVEVKCKAASGRGIISSIVLQSEDLDEVDWEFIGTTTTNVQMNYFGKGNTTTYDRMIEGAVSNPQQEVHSYALNWTSESLTWLIDNKPVRTLNYADAVGGKNYPQTPVNVRIGIWAGGDPNNEKGVIEWAGGETDYTKVPFTMTLESVKVINYSPGLEYKWTDRSGSFESIEVIGAGNEGGAPQNSQVLEPSAASTGKALQSGVDVPTATGGEFHEKPSATGGAAAETSCSEGEQPQHTGYPVQNGTVPASPQETPCSCGDVETVIVTGNPPPGTTLSTALPVQSTSADVPPAVTVPAVSNPPYPTTGLLVETSPAPSVPYPSQPSGGIPAVNSTATAPPAQFTGAASSNKIGAMLGLAAGAAVLAF